ncbi:DNA -binding domain-containing protein [Sphingobium scionense]
MLCGVRSLIVWPSDCRAPQAGACPQLSPTDFQRMRLTFLLHLLGLLATGLSTRELADAAVYPELGLHGSDWRAANERRQVQRLRDEALRLSESGYLDLLRGR